MQTHEAQGIEILDYFCPAIVSDDAVSGKPSRPSPETLPYAHPLLVYAELLHSGTERQVETASILYDKLIRKILEG